MNPDQQCVSLEIARKLKDLNVKQESMFYWCTPKGDFQREEYEKYDGFSLYINEEHFPYIYKDRLYVGGCGCCERDSETEESYSAFTVAELGEILPWEIQAESASRKNASLIIQKYTDDWHIAYVTDINLSPCVYIIDKKEANARAKMLIHLIENKIITFGEVIVTEFQI